MSRDNSILTTKDFTILEIMLDRLSERGAPMGRLLREKLETAIIMLRDEIPPHVATLNSRVRFRVDGGEAETRVLSHAPMGAPVGMFLPITAPRGLALLGLGEGRQYQLEEADGRREHLLLEKVLYQPEAERVARASGADAETPIARRARLRLVGGGAGGRVRTAIIPCGEGTGDDPGPSAA